MEKKSQTRSQTSYKGENVTDLRHLYVFLAFVLISCVFALAWLGTHGHDPEIYPDVIQNTNMTRSFYSKSMEFKLLWILLLGGSGLLLIAYILTGKLWKKPIPLRFAPRFTTDTLFVLIFAAVPFVNYLLYQQMDIGMLLPLILLPVLYAMGVEKKTESILLYFLADYAFLGLYYVLVMIGLTKNMDKVLFNVLAFFVACIISFRAKERPRLMTRALLVCQVLTIGLAFYILIDTYLYEGTPILIPTATGVKVAVVLFTVVALIENGYRIKTYWKEGNPGGNLISLSTAILSFYYLQMSGYGSIIRKDMRHPYECVIGFGQVFMKGQKLYDEYSPTSGLYSLLQGGFLELFGEGKMANYNAVCGVFFLSVFALTVYLLSRHIDMKYVFLLSLFFHYDTRLENYDRYFFILPIALTLTLPGLVKRKNLWLQVWILTTMFHVLYYPLLGVAVGFGFLPMGLWQAVSMVKRGQLRAQWKKPFFVLSWIAEFAVIACFVPLLWRMGKHILNMGNQTIWADGICMFGGALPNKFLGYLDSETYSLIRIFGYDLLRFVGLPVIGYLAIALLYTACRKRTFSEILSSDMTGTRIGVCAFLFVMPAIADTYTFCRSENLYIFSRADFVLYSVFIVLFIYALKHIRQSVWKYAVCLFVFLFPVLINDVGLTCQPNSVAYFTAGSEMLYVPDQDEDLPRLGACLIEKNMYNRIKTTASTVNLLYTGKVEEGTPVFGLGGQYSHVFLGDFTGSGTIEATVANGYDAAVSSAINLLHQPSVVDMAGRNYSCYYLYHWILTSGYYRYDTQSGFFLPAEKPQKGINKGLMSGGASTLDEGNTPSSLGESMASLKGFFTEPELPATTLTNEGDTFDISFAKTFDGDEADFLYLEFPDEPLGEPSYYLSTDFNPNAEFQTYPEGALITRFIRRQYNVGRTIHVVYTDEDGEEHRVICQMNKQKLLINLGASNAWLLNDHDDIRIEYHYGAKELDFMTEPVVRFLKLREVELGDA
ncbi:MAG: hypothetical protein K6G07_00225 [Lachnospiraceae bacterium]|nr:hypothetical protein [Lachnospiraceae bacterium]